MQDCQAAFPERSRLGDNFRKPTRAPVRSVRYDVYEQKMFTKGPGSVSHNNISALFEDRKGVIWIGSTAGLDRYDKDANEFQHFANAPRDPQSLAKCSV